MKEISDTYVVDTGHLVAYENTIQMKVGMVVGVFFSSFFSKEVIGKSYSRSWENLSAIKIN